MEHPIVPGLDIPIRSIFCIGRNYAKHAAEMGADIPKNPVIFLKPLSSICYSGDEVKLPLYSSNVHFEGEIVIAIAKSGKDISVDDALSHVAGIGCGIDFTARDLQNEAKKKGLPWSLSKGFEGFAPISAFKQIDNFDIQTLKIELSLNNKIHQSGLVSHMIFSIPILISYLSSIVTLHPGDLIFTGTPEGVGQVEEGDLVKASIPQIETSVSVQIS